MIPAAAALSELPQGWRFLLAGGFAAGVNWLVRFPLSVVLPYGAAVILAGAIGMTVGFVIYRYYVFPGSSRTAAQQVGGFVAVNLVGMAVVAAVAVILKDGLFPLIGLRFASEAIAHAVGIGAGAVANFVGHRNMTFA